MSSSTKYHLIIFLLITFFITKFSFGQKPVFGIKAGIALSNATINQTGADPNTLKTSARTGAIGGENKRIL